jgi:KDO2-lipid IV(A) lauroyltransferase
LRDLPAGIANLVMAPLARLAGIDLWSAMGAATGVFFAMALRGFPVKAADARARANWRRLRPDLADEAQTDAAMRRLWRGMGRTLAEYFLLGGLAPRVAVEGAAHLAAVRAGDAPLLVAALHLANWELIGPTLARLGYAATGPHQPPRNRYDYALITRARADAGLLTFPAWPGGLRRLRQALTGGDRSAWIYVDDFVRGRVSAPRLGRPERLGGNLRIAAGLAATTGAAIVPSYVVRTDGARFRMVFCEPFRMAGTANRGPVFEADLERLNAVYEAVVLEHLDQWFWTPNFGELDDEAGAPPPMSGALMDAG